ncbi:hypothetical protein FQR65_LT11049 [Abscondita terminalis]|nr:hypothetical protein FQR65_LT11049 [Abscondita terminalis]
MLVRQDGLGLGKKHLNIGIVNHEPNCNSSVPIACNSSALSCKFLDYLKDKDINMISFENETTAVDSVDRGFTYASVVIRENYTLALKSRFKNGRQVNDWDLLYSTVDVYRDVSVKDIATFLKLYLYESFVNFIGDYLESCEVNRDIVKPPILWNTPVYGSNTTDFTEYAAPGVLITISFFLSAGLTAVAILIERSEGIMERSLVMGVTIIELLISHVISEFVVMMMQIIVVVCFGVYVFNMALRGSMILLLELILFAGFCGMWYGKCLVMMRNVEELDCLGFALSSACDRETTAAYILLGSFFPMILLCGIIWPLEGMSEVLRTISYALPLTLPVESIRSIMQRGWDVTEPVVYRGFFSISVWTLIFLVISVLVLKFKKG